MQYEELKVNLPKADIQKLELLAQVCDVTVQGFLEDMFSNYLEEQAMLYDSFSKEAYEEATGNCWYYK